MEENILPLSDELLDVGVIDNIERFMVATFKDGIHRVVLVAIMMSNVSDFYYVGVSVSVYVFHKKSIIDFFKNLFFYYDVSISFSNIMVSYHFFCKYTLRMSFSFLEVNLIYGR